MWLKPLVSIQLHDKMEQRTWDQAKDKSGRLVLTMGTLCRERRGDERTVGCTYN